MADSRVHAAKRGASGPWYITDAAVEKYLAIAGRADTTAARDRAAVELERMAIATVESERVPRHIGQHTLRYRGPSPQRLQLIVSTEVRPEGPLPQLVDVWSEHGGKAHASGPGGRRSQEERRASGAKMVVSVSLESELVREVDAALGGESRSEYVALALRARLDADR